MFGRTGSHTDEDLSLPTRHTAAPGHRRDDYCGPMKVVVCAFGTRGDVQPLVAIAAGLAEKDWCNEVTFVTHKQHCEGFVRTLLRQEANSKCKVLPVDSPPVIWKGIIACTAKISVFPSEARTRSVSRSGGSAAAEAVSHDVVFATHRDYNSGSCSMERLAKHLVVFGTRSRLG